MQLSPRRYSRRLKWSWKLRDLGRLAFSLQLAAASSFVPSAKAYGRGGRVQRSRDATLHLDDSMNCSMVSMAIYIEYRQCLYVQFPRLGPASQVYLSHEVHQLCSPSISWPCSCPACSSGYSRSLALHICHRVRILSMVPWTKTNDSSSNTPAQPFP